MFRGQIFILIIIYIRNSSCSINATYNAGRELWKLYSMLDEIPLTSTHDLRGLDELLRNGLNQELKNQMHAIHKQLATMGNSINSKIIHESIVLPPSEIMLYKCMDTFELFILSIDETYEEFYQYMTNSSYNSNDRLQYSGERMILEIEEKMSVIRKIMIDAGEFLPGHVNLPFAITGYASSAHNEICGGPRIISDILVDLFTIVIIAEVKVHVMLAFANMQRFSEYGVWKVRNSLARKQFGRQFGSYVKIFRLNVQLADSVYLRACDPDNGIWIRNESFYELEGTFQTTIFRYHWATCKYYSCNTAWFKNEVCSSSFHDRRTTCSATVSECAYLGSVQGCALKSGPYKFQYVNSTELGLLGKNSACPENNGYIIEDGIGSDWNYAACACNCYSSDNKISLMITESKMKYNKVITGLRFLWKNQILHIQPREGMLDANGHIRRNTERWVPISNNIPKSKIRSINKENRVFFFDDLRLPSGYVLTGVKFNKVTRETVTGFAIEIFGVPFDYESGQLHFEQHLQISRKASNVKSGKGLSFKAINPIHTTMLHSLSRRAGKYVSLERSELEDDFGQSTLPFFDAVPLKTQFPSALDGIGVFHKGVEGYAGFISLRAYGLSYEKYFTDFESVFMNDGRVSFNQSQHD